MRKWMLEFDDQDTEREFRAHDDASGLRAATFAQVVGILFTVVYAAVDFLVLHGFVPAALIIRAFTVGLFLLGILLIRSVPTVQKNLQIGTVVLLALFVVPVDRVAYSVLAVLVMSGFLWISHRPGRYTGG